MTIDAISQILKQSDSLPYGKLEEQKKEIASIREKAWKTLWEGKDSLLNRLWCVVTTCWKGFFLSWKINNVMRGLLRKFKSFGEQSVEEQAVLCKKLDAALIKKLSQDTVKTILPYAIGNCTLEIFKTMYSGPEKNNPLVSLNETLLRKAVEKKDLEIVKYLLDTKYKSTESHFHVAVTHGLVNVAQFLLENGAKLEEKDGVGRTALHIAVEKEQPELVKLLLKQGADLEAKDGVGRTALHIAVEQEQPKLVELLLGKDASLEAKAMSDRTALHMAVQQKQPELVKLLLEKKAPLEAADISGQTALHMAVEQGQTELVRLLVEKGASLEAKDRFGRTPSDLAQKSRNAELITLCGRKAKKSTSTQP